MTIDLFNTRKQLTFYGAYHSNPTNVLIHVFGVPLLLWSGQVLFYGAPLPSFIPEFTYKINDYLEFDMNFSALWTGACLLYYFVLEPVATLLYVPQTILSLLTATSFAHRGNAVAVAAAVHAFSWVAQFLGHGLAEKRAPALLDNLLGALVLAPFFVHLELLFGLGYRPQLHKDVQNSVGLEIARIKKIEGDKKRAKEVKKQ